MADVKLNIVFITLDGLYIHHELEVLIIKDREKILLKVPFHHIQGITIMSHSTISPSALGKCLKKGIHVSYLTPGGKFLGRLEGRNSGNILLRKQQFLLKDKEKVNISKSIIAGKIQNQRLNLMRTARELSNENHVFSIREVVSRLEKNLEGLERSDTLESIRGYEGLSAKEYFSVFDHCILHQKSEFEFTKRSKRPPRSRINALLSFVYSILTNDCLSACQNVGLDPYEGVLHDERPGRPSLALDLMEEFRPFADRFVLTLINRKQIKPNHIEERVGSVYFLTQDGKKELITNYQKRKLEIITHHFLQQKTTIGELILLQARLLAKSIRNPKVDYVPHIWR